MIRNLARCSLPHIHGYIAVSQKVLQPSITLKASFQPARSSSTYGSHHGGPVGENFCHRGLSKCKTLREETAGRAEKLRALGAEEAFPNYDPLDHAQVNLMEKWYASGPPPLSEYRLSWGKYKGKRLQDVPDVYFAKYLLPRRDSFRIHGGGEYGLFNAKDYIFVAALDEHMEKNPDLKSQPGRKKTVVRGGGIEAKPKRKYKRKPKDAISRVQQLYPDTTVGTSYASSKGHYQSLWALAKPIQDAR